jgi:hypothetical protein
LFVNNDPSVPPKQNPGAGVRQIAFALPPEVPSGTGAVYGCRLIELMENSAVNEEKGFAFEVAVMSILAGAVPSGLASVGTVFGAVYKPVGDIEPQIGAPPPAAQPIVQPTPVFDEPVTVAANCTVWKVWIFDTSVVIVTVTAGGWVLPPPPPQDTIVMAPVTTRTLSRHARLIMELPLRSDVEFTGGNRHSVHPSAKKLSGVTAFARLVVLPGC